MTALTVTAKGQITLKQEILRHLNITPGQKIEAETLPDGRVVLAPVRKKGSIKNFSGMLARRDGPKLTIEEINEIIAKGWAGEL